MKLPEQPWRVHPATLAVLDALEAAGGAGAARFVGGCVRDALVGRPVKDIDLATTLAPKAVLDALGAAGLKAVPTGLEHGVVTAVSGGRPFEIATLRRDLETDGRRARVAFTDDWALDAARRDFRLNALYADRHGAIFDPTGGGIADAQAGAVVFVGDPRTRIREDALRILRFFRFLAWYGRAPADGAALAACRDLAALVDGLSAERVGAETLKLLAAEDPRPAMRLMAEAGVLERLAPEAADLPRFEALVDLEGDLLRPADGVLRLAALLPDDPSAAGRAAEALRLANAERDRLAAALRTEPPLVSWMSPRETRRAVYSLGHRAFLDRAMLAAAGAERPAAAMQWRALIPIAESWARPSLPLTGDEAATAGTPRGPMIGKVLKAVEDWWIDHDFVDDKLAIMERLKAVVQGMAF